MSPTTPRGARELTCTMSRASDANENLAQCGDNEHLAQCGDNEHLAQCGDNEQLAQCGDRALSSVW